MFSIHTSGMVTSLWQLVMNLFPPVVYAYIYWLLKKACSQGVWVPAAGLFRNGLATLLVAWVLSFVAGWGLFFLLSRSNSPESYVVAVSGINTLLSTLKAAGFFMLAAGARCWYLHATGADERRG